MSCQKSCSATWKLIQSPRPETSRKVITVFRWDSKDYSKSSAGQQEWARELIEKLKLKGDERVLDIGSGDGKVTAEIATLIPHGEVVGIDSSEEMVKFARENFPTTDYPNLHFEVMDARELSFNKEFDVVFSNATLHWVTDHLTVLKGIKRSLKPRGRMLLQMGGKGNAKEIFNVLNGVTKRREWKKYFEDFSFKYGFYGVEEYRSWLSEAGLTAVRVELIEKDMIHKGKEGLSAWIRTTWLPYTQSVPEELRRQFIDEVGKGYIRLHPVDCQGLVHIRMVRLEVEALS